jgi:hypothetical protein
MCTEGNVEKRENIRKKFEKWKKMKIILLWKNFLSIVFFVELARDADGNAICPACKEPIGTNPAQLAKHLALERSRVQEALQK